MDGLVRGPGREIKETNRQTTLLGCVSGAQLGGGFGRTDVHDRKRRGVMSKRKRKRELHASGRKEGGLEPPWRFSGKGSLESAPQWMKERGEFVGVI